MVIILPTRKSTWKSPFSLFQTLEYYPQKALPLCLMQNFKPTHIGVVVLLSQIKMLADYLVVNSEGEAETSTHVVIEVGISM